MWSPLVLLMPFSAWNFPQSAVYRHHHHPLWTLQSDQAGFRWFWPSRQFLLCFWMDLPSVSIISNSICQRCGNWFSYFSFFSLRCELNFEYFLSLCWWIILINIKWQFNHYFLAFSWLIFLHWLMVVVNYNRTEKRWNWWANWRNRQKCLGFFKIIKCNGFFFKFMTAVTHRAFIPVNFLGPFLCNSRRWLS